MAKYLVLYRSNVSAPDQMAAEGDPQAGMELWMQWAGKAGSAIVDLGSPLSATGVVGSGGKPDTSIGGFSILEADSQADLEKLLDGHPHFQSPGDPSIETLEFLPIPGM